MIKSLSSIVAKTKNLTLLYVEDDELVAKSTLKLLKKLFNTVIYAQDGKKGIEKFNENYIDIIITDINMPNLDGMDMLYQIKELNRSVPSIIMTAHNELEYYKNAIELNIKGYLTKPISINKLIELLGNISEDITNINIQKDKLIFLQESNEKLIQIGYMLSTEKDYEKILETILVGAKDIANADGGTLYLYNKQNKTLEFKIVMNDKLNMHFGGAGEDIPLPPLKIYDEENQINNKNVSVVCAMENKLINISDIYNSTSYDFSGAKAFDTMKNYKTTSMLVIPMRNRDNELVGVLQLINKLSNDIIIPFNNHDENLITSMSAQATMTLQNNQLVKDLETFLYSLIKSVGSALGEKSEYTAKHVNNVADLSILLAEGISQNQTIFKDESFSDDELEQIRLAAWLHDIGKITTPEYIVDKSTRLETIYDRINDIDTRFELIKKDIEISYLKHKITKEDMDLKYKQLDEDLIFLHDINSGDIFMSEDKLERLNKIQNNYNILTKNELYNLSIKKGTLTNEEREIINNHVTVTYKMLQELPFPKKFDRVAKIAGSHHKTVDNKGYAHKDLLNAPMTIADKLLAVADIFEALSAHDRPYRGPNKLSQIINILKFMVQDKHLDKDIVRIFIEDKLYQQYVDKNFLEDQIDEIDIDLNDLYYKV